jgi:hypothetical protein
MVRWYHLIMTAYGFWLPNDPRGSWSEFVASWELYKFGAATKTSEKRSLAHAPHDKAQRLAAKTALKYPPVRFDQRQRALIAEGFAKAVREGGYAIHAHSHAIVARHERTIERIGQHLKSKATMALTQAGAHPLARFGTPSGIPTPWSEGVWSVFINDKAQLQAAIAYVQRHPLKEGLSQIAYEFLVDPVE